MLDLDVQAAIARSEEIIVNTAADHGECPADCNLSTTTRGEHLTT
jgi:hypothetical protein